MANELMTDLGQLETALKNAHAAGDVQAARIFAAEIIKMRGLAQVQANQPKAPNNDLNNISTMQGLAGPQVQGEGPLAELSSAAQKLDHSVRTGANTMTFGLADRFAGGMDALTGRANSYKEGVENQLAETKRIREEEPVYAAVGDISGGLTGGIGLAKSGVTLAGRLGPNPNLMLRTGAFGVEGAGYGAAHGAGNTYSDNWRDYALNAGKGAAFGGAIGSALPVAGTATKNLVKLGSSFFGPSVEGAGRGASSMMRGAAMADEAGLRGLSVMGPEAMLVDVGPAFKGLGQGAGTGGGPGTSKLVNTLKGRDERTGLRLADALDQNYGPSIPPSRIESRLSGDRAYVDLQYEPIVQKALPTNTSALANQLEIEALLLRGPEQKALQSVRRMLDTSGKPGSLETNPKALFSTRDSIDGLISNETNAKVIKVLTDARRAVDAELKKVAPGIKTVDAQKEELWRQSEGLKRGSQILDAGKTAIHPNELAQEIAQAANPRGTMTGPSAVPLRIKQGARAEIDRIVGTNVNDLAKLERTIATPQDWNYRKLEKVFGSNETAKVAKALLDNRTFRQSYQDIVQNSQTAQRTQSAAAMDSAQGNIPRDVTMTGLGLRALQLISRALSGASSASTKDEVGRILSSQGPEAQRIAEALLSSAVKASKNSEEIGRIIGSKNWIGAVTGADDSREKLKRLITTVVNKREN